MANIEGRNPIIEALRGDRAIDKIMISNSSKEGSIKKIIGMAKEKNIVKTISTLIASPFIYFFMPLLLPLAIFLLFLLIISIYLLGSISFMLSPIQYMKKRSKLLLSFFLFKPSSFWEKSF